MKKTKLQVEHLSVESFATGQTAEGRGTVRGQADDCTWVKTCLCPTAYYHCGTGPHSIFSCDYTQNERCELTGLCPTPPITPAC